MNILFVRHGESFNNILNNLLKFRRKDPNLTSLGKNQCLNVGKYLNENNYNITHSKNIYMYSLL